MSGLNKKKSALLILTGVSSIAFISVAIHAIIVGKYINAIALLSSTMLMLNSAFDILT